MHELSIVLKIINIAEEEAQKAGAASISAIELAIGKLSTIEPAAFDFAWKHGVKNSMLENARRVTSYIDGKGLCNICGTEFFMDALFQPCPECGNYYSKILEGKELQIKSLRIEEKIET